VAQQSRRKFPPAVPTTRTSDAEVQGRKDPTEICRRLRINPQPLQPRPSPQPPRYLQTEPFCRPGRVASAGGLNSSDQHPSQARSGLSDNAIGTSGNLTHSEPDPGPCYQNPHEQGRKRALPLRYAANLRMAARTPSPGRSAFLTPRIRAPVDRARAAISSTTS